MKNAEYVYIYTKKCSSSFFLYVKDALTSLLKNSTQSCLSQTHQRYIQRTLCREGHVNLCCFPLQTIHSNVLLRHCSLLSPGVEARGGGGAGEGGLQYFGRRTSLAVRITLKLGLKHSKKV